MCRYSAITKLPTTVRGAYRTEQATDLQLCISTVRNVRQLKPVRVGRRDAIVPIHDSMRGAVAVYTYTCGRQFVIRYTPAFW